MKFQDIFNEDGLYVANDFKQGVCFEVRDSVLYIRTYETSESISYATENALMHKNLFNKVYTKVFTRQSLFK
jgi:hypothetical protein